MSFEAIVDEEGRRFFNNLPTTLHLEADVVDRLRAAGRRLLRESPEFRAFLAAIRPSAPGGGPPDEER